MKKIMSFSFVFILSLILLGFNVNLVQASDLGCTGVGPYSTTTGQLCDNPHDVVGCQAGFAFSPVTGQSCVNSEGGGSQDNSNSSDIARFNNLFKSNFKIGLRGNNDVKALQQFLKEQGYYFGKIDGSYGRISARAVKDFQNDNNLTSISIPPTKPEQPTYNSQAPVIITESQANIPNIPTPEPVTENISAPIVPMVVSDAVLPAPNSSSLRVRTDGTVSITNESLLVRGTVTAGARSGTESWFELTTNPTLYKVSESTVSTKASRKSNTRFEYLFSGLKVNTTYYYRACAGNTSLGQKSCGATVSSTTTNI